MRLFASLLLSSLLLAAAAPASAPAATLGIADNHPEMFSSPLFSDLHVKQARYLIPWDAALKGGRTHRRRRELKSIRRWLTAARRSHVRPLVSFNVSVSGRYSRRAPKVRTYRKAFKAFHHRFPSVRQYIPWNEVNQCSQPTCRKPKLAARYYNVVRAHCRHCTVVAAAVLDSSNAVAYLAEFKRYARGRPRLWAVHNYLAVNRRSTHNLRRILHHVRGRVWLTETGGIVVRRTPTKRSRFRFSLRRAARAETRSFKIARGHGKVTRIYHYQWQNTGNPVWDSALIDSRGHARPAYVQVKKYAQSLLH